MKYFPILILLFLFSLPQIAEAQEETPQDKAAIARIDKFLAAAVQNESFPGDTLEAAVKSVEAARDAGEYSSAISDGLVQLYPPYADALLALVEENTEVAHALLQELSASEDPYLAADASFFLARGLVMRERYEEAIPLLAALNEKQQALHNRHAEAEFLRGVALADTLNKEEAMTVLESFLEKYPHAPERMRVGAAIRRHQLELVKEGEMTDVQLRMEWVRRRLDLQDSGKKTQDQQEKIVSLLDDLIEKAQQQEQQAQSQAQQQQQPQPSEGSANPAAGQGQNGPGVNDTTPGPVVRRTYRGPQSPWGKLRDKERDPAFSAIKTKFPARYHDLIEQYYKSFQEGE